VTAPAVESGKSLHDSTTNIARNSLSNSASKPAIAYWLHLSIPALLLVDVVHARRLHMALRSDLALGAAAAAWILTAVLGYFVSRDRARFLDRLRGPLLSFYAVMLVFCSVELVLRLAHRDLRPAIWRPGMRLVFRPDLSKFPGVSPVSHFSANEFGLRGPTLPRNRHEFKIIAVGGSTTLCLMLDDQKTWPQQLMYDLNDRQTRIPVWVSNAGVNGHTAVHHLMLLRSMPILHQANLILFLVGINDFQFTLSHEGAPTQTDLDHVAEGFRENILAGAYSPYPLYRRLRTYRSFRRALDVAIERTNKEDEKDTLDQTQLRALRSSRPSIAMPDITIGLAEYRVRLKRLANECQQLELRCLFMTQPSVWHSNIPPESERLLLFGWVGPPFQPIGHVSVSDLQKGLYSYNQAMLQVCQESHIECLDLASALPKNSSVFYDDVHLTEKGADLAADAIASYILRRPPFGGS
jgi:lysophospholipase L1-like esterase